MKAKFLKARYIAAALTVAASIAATPASIEAAYAIRGYKAIGGEYLVIPLGIIAAFIILELAKAWVWFRLWLKKDNAAVSSPTAEYDGVN